MTPDRNMTILAGLGLVVLAVLAWRGVVHGDAVLTYVAAALIPVFRTKEASVAAPKD